MRVHRAVGGAPRSKHMGGTAFAIAMANLDPVAYVRFASVYRNFREAKDFEQFVEQLDGIATIPRRIRDDD